MFQFRGFPTYTYLFSICSMILHHGCSHIRISADRSLFAAPRSLSQLVTSFVGSQCQGILHMLFFAWTTFMLWSYEQSSDCSGLNITVLSLSLELLCFILCSVGADFCFIRPWQNCFFYPLSLTKKPDFVFNRFLVFSLYFVCHVCHTNSFFKN